MSKIVLFLRIQFSISTQFSSNWPIDRIPSGATTPGQSEPGSNGNEGVLHIPPKLQHYWSLTIRLFSIIFRTLIGGVLLLSRDAVSVFYSPHNPNKIIQSKWILSGIIVKILTALKLSPKLWICSSSKIDKLLYLYIFMTDLKRQVERLGNWIHWTFMFIFLAY